MYTVGMVNMRHPNCRAVIFADRAIDGINVGSAAGTGAARSNPVPPVGRHQCQAEQSARGRPET